MTIKEIAGLTGKTEKTVRQWIQHEQKVLTQEQKVLTKGHSRDYNLEEVIAILKSGKISESLIGLLIENSKNKNEEKSNLPTLNSKDIEIISTIVSMTVSKTIEALDKRMNVIENKYEERKALLPAPEKSDRENLNQFIRSYAHKNNLNHSVVWLKLYQEAYYRLNVNLKVNAYNRNMAIIDYADQEGYIPELLSIAIDLFK